MQILAILADALVEMQDLGGGDEVVLVRVSYVTILYYHFNILTICHSRIVIGRKLRHGMWKLMQT